MVSSRPSSPRLLTRDLAAFTDQELDLYLEACGGSGCLGVIDLPDSLTSLQGNRRHRLRELKGRHSSHSPIKVGSVFYVSSYHLSDSTMVEPEHGSAVRRNRLPSIPTIS